MKQCGNVVMYQFKNVTMYGLTLFEAKTNSSIEGGWEGDLLI